jgi:hypothetical protein
MLVLAWFSGLGIGLIFLAIKPWFPQVAGVGSTIYARANMIASGKMFLANSTALSIWCCSPGTRCFTSSTRPAASSSSTTTRTIPTGSTRFWSRIGLMMIGFMGEAYTRKHASLLGSPPMKPPFCLCPGPHALARPRAGHLPRALRRDRCGGGRCAQRPRRALRRSRKIVGAFAPTETGIEVIALSEDGGWGRVNTGEQAGWTSMRFSRASPARRRRTGGLRASRR